MDDDNHTQTGTPLSEFWRYATDFRSLTTWIATTVVAAPFLDLVVGIGPPWPSRLAISSCLTIIVGVIVMYSFEFWRSASKRSGRSVFRSGLLATAAFFVAYIFASAFLISDSDNVGGREIVGYEMYSDIGLMANANPEKWTPQELLMQFHDPMKVWTRNSVILSRVLLLLLWLMVWLSLAVGMSAFVSLRWIAADAKR